MENLKNPETVTEGLVASKQVDFGEEKCVESVFAPVAEIGCIDPCKVKGFDPIDSSSRGDVNIKGISLFVDLTGGVANKRDRKGILRDRDVGQHEFRVNVGDLVWAVIKKQKQTSWWPALVCDGSNAPKEAVNWPIREDDYLVRCFGNGSYIWCSASELKPFVGYFDRLPSESQAKKFLDALDEAVAELGHRVKTEFTCSCFCKMKMEKSGNFGNLSVSQLEPAKFLDYIKDLARVISVPNKIDYVVKQSCLSAFYRSLGHLQIPLHQLKSTFGSPSKVKTKEENACFNDDFERSEKPSETRERRNIRFLSYPGECGVEESVMDVNKGVNLNATNGQSQPVKKPRKKWSRKSKGVQANVCSSDVLSQLQFAAQDCVFPCESVNFDLVERFISGFRRQAFNEISNEIPIETLNHENLQETMPKKVKTTDKSIILPTLGNVYNFGSLITKFQSLNLEACSMENNRTEGPANQITFINFGDQPMTQKPLCKLEPKRRKKNAENITSTHAWNAYTNTFPIVNGHMAGLHQAPVFHFTNGFGSTPPCFTENHVEPQVGLGPAGLDHVPKKRGRKKKNIDLQANPGSTKIPAFTGNHGEPQVGLVPAGLIHVPKKRGRKRKNIDLQADPGSTITPNLSESGTEKKTEKKVKVKEVGVPCIDLSYNKVQQDNVEEVKGTAFLLKFSPDYPLPSNQDLNAIFLKYGELIESETQVLSDNLSGQVVFLDSSSAGWAFWGLQNDKPFGPVLVSYKIQHLSGAESLAKFKTPIRSPSGFKPTDSQPLIGSTMIPNLSESGTVKKTEKRVKIKEVGVPCIDLSYNKVHQDNVEEVKGTAFLLKFSPEYPLPSNQDLNSVFSKYGELIESETQVLKDNLSGQVVFLDSSSAGGAFWGLQNDKPFGPVLVNYKIQHLSGAESLAKFKTPIRSPSGFKPMEPQPLIGLTMTPNTNTNSTEIQIVKRSKTIEEIRLPSMDNLSYNKVHQGNGEVKGTALLLKFSPNHPLPSFQDLNSIFCKYGELNEFETQVSGQNLTGQVVFLNPSAAGNAIQRLAKDQPFGPALLSYRVHHLYSVQSAIRVKNPVNIPLELKPCQGLEGIKKNLEMMKLMLEKAGDSLLPEMRGKLESEIKGLMNKVSVMNGSSSSSSCV